MRSRHAGLFHVTSRSNAEEHIFVDDRDYLAGIQILGELVREGPLRCYGFCFMPTHYHLLAWFDDDMLSRSIHRLNKRYAAGFNRRHGRRGHVFDSPFTSVEVTKDGHLYRLPDYIAENPPRRPWAFSSYDARFGFVETLDLIAAA
jgi:REP element-mobilizing transposase RayT